MTAVHTSIRRHRLGLLLLSAVFTLLMALSIATPSRAFAAEAVPTCNPTATNGCVNGILQDADKKPIANVELKLSGQEEATTTTDAEGKWAFSVNADGKYTVTMDESVAKDHGLKAATAEVEIQKKQFRQGSSGGSLRQARRDVIHQRHIRFRFVVHVRFQLIQHRIYGR